ncbi:AAA family ATPase, partial [Lysobacter sp. 2RAB21]
MIFNRGTQYSEAFAGSGEIAAVSAVVRILNAPPQSLILLDEPETSLHPGAQRALLKFLLERIKIDKHQIIISTHSMEFLRGLPHNAIKVFEDGGAGRSRVLPQSSPSAALK